MSYPYQQVSVLGNALNTYGFNEENTTDGLALDTFGFITGILATSCWSNALSEGITLTTWSAALSEGDGPTTWSPSLSEGVTLSVWSAALSEGDGPTAWTPAISEGDTGTVWEDGVSEIPPGSSCS